MKQKLIEAASGKTVNKVELRDGFLTPAQTGARWKMHRESIRRMLRQRRLASIIISRRRLIPLSEIARVEEGGLINSAA